MLVLSRQRDEAVQVGDDVKVVVVDVRGDKVRLGIDAPSKYRVYRKELYDEIVAAIKAGNPAPLERKKGTGHGMLVLSRQKEQVVVILDPADWLNPLVAITIVNIRGEKVRCGFTADRALSVHRSEVYDAIQKSKVAQAPPAAT